MPGGLHMRSAVYVGRLEMKLHDPRRAVGWAERSETHAFQMVGRLPHMRGSRCDRPTHPCKGPVYCLVARILAVDT